MDLENWKPKHWFRLVSQVAGISLLVIGLADGKSDFLPDLDPPWLLVGGVVLVALGARKRPPFASGG